MKKLFAVYLGGYTPNCNVEVHDMVFVVGETIEETFPDLVQKWFIKSYDNFHYDGYMDLSIVDDHRVSLSREPSSSDLKLFYIHLGGYDPHEFTEFHKNCFLVAPDIATAKSRARKSWGEVKVPHKDVQFDIESCLQLEEVDKYYIHLQPTQEQPNHDFHLGYNVLPQNIIHSAKLPSI